MNIDRKTTITEEGERANTNRQTAIKESKMKITTANLTRRAGLAAMGNEGIVVFQIRLAAVAGLVAAVVLFVNAAKRAGLIPISSATQLVAPLAQALAIILVVGLAAVAMRQ